MIERCAENPIIRPEDVKPSRDGYKVMGAFNPGAVLFGDRILLLLRVAETCTQREGFVRVPVWSFESGGSQPEILEFRSDDPDLRLKDTRGVVYKGKKYLTTLSHIRVATSTDGIHFTVREKPFIFPSEPRERFGCEDARVLFLDGRYYINFTVVSEDSWATMLAVTEDFVNVSRLGLIFHPENKDVAVFPEKIGGKYAALHRPNNSGFGKASIWYAESPDLLHWGNHRCIVRPRETHWEAMKIGGGAPPLKTPEGWLVIYHAKGEGSVYSLFCLLLDLEEPWKVVRRAEKPLLAPELPFEREGFFGNVVFTNGMVEKDGRIFLYYGAADQYVGLAFTTVEELLSSF